MAFLKQFAAAWSRLCQKRRPNDGLWPQARSPVQSLPGRIWDAPRRHASADADMARGVVPVPHLMWRGGDRWMISGQFECARPAQLLASNMTLGIDLGVSMPVTAFDGEGFLLEPTAPRKLREALRRLRRAHRRLSARQKGSARRKAQRIRVNTRKVRERRSNILHQISHLLTAKAAVINGNVHRLQRRLARAAGVEPWFPSRDLLPLRRHQFRHLNRRVFVCAASGHPAGRDRNPSLQRLLVRRGTPRQRPCVRGDRRAGAIRRHDPGAGR
jgi:Probable transposase